MSTKSNQDDAPPSDTEHLERKLKAVFARMRFIIRAHEDFQQLLSEHGIGDPHDQMYLTEQFNQSLQLILREE